MQRTASPKLAIFDHDGVLVDSFDFHQRAWLELGRRTGLPFTEELIHHTFGMTNPSIFRELPGIDLDPAEIERLGALKEACYRDIARDHLVLMPGVHSLLVSLRERGVLLSIGSSGPRANLDLTVEVCGLDGFFTSISSLEDVSRGKPDPEVFLVAAKKANTSPQFCVVFEDAPVGVQAAKSAGMLAIGVGTTHPLERLVAAGADHAVETLSGFDPMAWLGRLAAGS